MTPPLDRTAVLGDDSLRGRRFAVAHTEVVDAWLAELYAEVVGDRSGCALVATGGHGRNELTPGSDLDLLLLHDGRLDPDTAQKLWYPIWDTGMKLGHSFRTRPETLQLATNDLATATALLSVRCLAGDAAAVDELGEAARAQWAKGAKRSLVELADAVDARHESAGEVAFALEPDLKEGRGGLRDVQAIGWALAALPGLDIVDPDRLAERYDVLLAARVELHRATGRAVDRLLLQDQDEVARRLGLDDADVLMARVAGAARTIAWESDEAWFEIRRQLGASRFRRGDKRIDLGHGVELVGGRVELADGTRPEADSVLRVATAAARRRARIGRATLEWLRDAPDLPDPWPAEARDLFVELLGCGHDAVSVIESLDHADLWLRLVPEWAPNRSRPQRNAYHRFTVDRHLLEATANAAALVERVGRPDLLLLGTLLHDIGKGYPGDHAIVGRDLAADVCRRIGLSATDTAVVQTLVEHHLLLPDVATRRDLDDPVTVRSVAAHAGNSLTLELLWALTEADSIATGTAAWGSWKEGLVAALVERARHVLDGGDVTEVAATVPHTATQRDLVARCTEDGQVALSVDGDRLTVVAPDRHALFSRVAAVLALNGLDVTEASARSEGTVAIDEFRVQSAFGTDIAWTKVERDLGRALRGRLAIEPRLAERARSYRRTRLTARTLDPSVRVLNEASADSTVVEVVGPDSIGLLYRLTRALADLDLDIRSAKVATMGNDVVDAFYVRTAEGAKVDDPDDLAEIRAALLHALLVQPV